MIDPAFSRESIAERKVVRRQEKEREEGRLNFHLILKRKKSTKP
jgi:hypothetical protein